MTINSKTVNYDEFWLEGSGYFMLFYMVILSLCIFGFILKKNWSRFAILLIYPINFGLGLCFPKFMWGTEEWISNLMSFLVVFYICLKRKLFRNILSPFREFEFFSYFKGDSCWRSSVGRASEFIRKFLMRELAIISCGESK